jgi:predicted nucleic acid-binding Zn ribbon protein
VILSAVSRAPLEKTLERVKFVMKGGAVYKNEYAKR